MVDVGANRGQSIPAFKNLAPESNIVALEPEPKSAERLALRYRRDPTVTIHGCALGERATTVTFFVPTYGRWDCDGMSAIGRKAATEWLRDPGRMLLFNEAKLTVKEHQIECRTLDSYKLAPLLIKLHAQGDVKRPATFTWYLTKNHARQVSTGRPAGGRFPCKSILRIPSNRKP
jgi:FkbM family methyltransferase